ncbi:N-acetylglucosamine kinase [Thioclava atlantica]|uniref:N-acetylglucosamine kinase n=1 Tax=Thioclava atlantica TaxID=1317124 RepID=A0A085TT05_9RHOB|nr:BadF/BadG/BcrA/BcrD ATPase family protein [Thioclava atlantica]KFE33852.1 N-acetylglucosamine kinase [Thioclava atlantica]
MPLLFGLDSGGTKTVAALADGRGEVVRLVYGPGLDPFSMPGWRDSLARIVHSLTAGLEEPVSCAVLGLPFHTEIRSVSHAQNEAVSSLFSCDVLVENDVRIAFDGAFTGKGGVLVLAGTGSMAWASAAGSDAPHVRTGGWGDLFGDEGSAFWIGREALAMISHELDGRAPNSGFSEEMLARIGIGADEVIDWTYRLENPRRTIAGLARLVGDLADEGQPRAVELLQRAAHHLALAAKAAWKQADPRTALRWSYAGGVMQNALVREAVTLSLGAQPLPAILPPLGGALWRAAEQLKLPIDPTWIERLSQQLSAQMRQHTQQETLK